MEIIKFNSIEEFVAAACGLSDMPDYNRTSRTGGQDFCGVAKFEDAVKLAREGWAEGAEQASKIATAINERIHGSMTEKQETFYDVCGSAVDIGRFVTGVPENMMEFEVVERRESGKFIRVVVNMSVSRGVSQTEIMRKGASTAALVDTLEGLGYRCEVDAAYANTGLEVLVRLKNTGDPLEMDRLAYAIAHPSSFRSLFFSYQETKNAAFRQMNSIYRNGGYGRVADVSAETAQADITVGKMYLCDDSASAAWVMGQLKELGIEVEGATA